MPLLLFRVDEAAARGDLQVGDVLVEAESQKITASSVYEVASVLLGPPGGLLMSEIALTSALVLVQIDCCWDVQELSYRSR